VHGRKRNGGVLFFLVNLPAWPPGQMPAMDAGENRTRLLGRLAADWAVFTAVQIHERFQRGIHFSPPMANLI
jgi:hypothetical protein